MNIYIIEEVLTDYTSGMVIIAASDLNRCRELYVDRFNYQLEEFDAAIANNFYKVIEDVKHDEGIISIVWSGS